MEIIIAQTLEGLPIALEMTFINKRYQPEKIDYIKKFQEII